MRRLAWIGLTLLCYGMAYALPLSRSPDFLPPPPAVVEQDPPAAAAYREGLRHLAQADYEAAQLAFRRALALDKGQVHALLGLAETAFRRGRGDEGGRLLAQALRQAPQDAHVQASYGRWQATLGRYREAEAALKRAAELDPRLVRPRMDLADLFATALRKPQAAIALYREVLQLEPNHAGAHYALGVTQLRLGEPAAARTALETAARLAPENPLPALALAQLFRQQGQTDTALHWVERALKLQPSLAEALELRGDLRQARNDNRAALTDYAAAVLAQPQRASAWVKLGMLQQVAGDVPAAMRSYREAIQHDPQAAVAYNNLAWLGLQQGGDLKQAEAWARKAVELAPRSPEFLDTLGWLLRARGQRDQAEQTLARAAALPGASADTFYHLGVVRQELGHLQAARQAYEQALSRDRNHAQAQQALQRLMAGR